MEVRPGYKQTEVGVIPEAWELSPFNALGSVVDGDRGANYPGSGDFGSDGYCLFLNAGNVTKAGFRFGECSFISRERDERLSKGRLKRQDIVLTTRGTVGNFAYFDSTVPFERLRVNSGMVILRNNSATLETRFLYSLLQSHVVEKQIVRLSFGSAQPQLTVRGISTLSIVVPPLPEQRAIAETLSDVNALLGALDQLLAKKRDLKQASLQRLLNGHTRLPGFDGEWIRLNMAANSTLKARIGWQGLTTAEYLKIGDYYLVTGTDFFNGRIAWLNCCFVAAQRYTQDTNIQLHPKDILLTKDGTIGKVAFIDHLPGPGTLNSGVFVIRPKDDAYDPQFLYYVLTSRIFDEFLTKLQAGSTISHLYQKDFATFSFRAPASLSEQIAIAEVLADMDTELAALEKRRDKTRDIKRGIVQELLTGRTRLG